LTPQQGGKDTASEQETSLGDEAVGTDDSNDYDFSMPPRGSGRRVISGFRRHRLAVASLVLLTLMCTAGLLSPKLAPYGYAEINPSALSEAPSWAHPFGTDGLGRDYLSRVLLGIGTEVRIAVLVGLVGTLIGVVIGVTAGYYGGLVETVLMRATDLLLTLPPLIIVLVAAAEFHATTPGKVALLLACLLWLPVARVTRATCLSLREKEYVEAARAMGASSQRVILRHLLPNALSSIVVAASLMTGGAIILETTISYLGYGIPVSAAAAPKPQPSLGDVMSGAKDEGLFNWWGLTFPGLTIVLMVMSINFIGDGLRDALDPTTRSAKVGSARRRRGGRHLLSESLGQTFSRGAAAATNVIREVRPRLPRMRLRLFRQVADLDRKRHPIPGLNRQRNTYEGRRKFGSAVPRLIVEVIAVTILIGGAGAAVYLLTVHKAVSPWPVAGARVQDVSRARGAQTEVSIAQDPSNPRVLLAVSNDSLLRTVRVLSSANGGLTWSSLPGPYLGRNDCARGDPTVAVAPRGRQYIGFIVNSFCLDNDPWPYLAVAARAGPTARWAVKRVVTPPTMSKFDDKPTMAVAPGGRIYIVWSRLVSETYETTVIAWSDDGARTWSSPRIMSRSLVYPQLASVTVGPTGTVYVAGVDGHFGIWVAQSTDRGQHFTLRSAAPLPGNRATTCIAAGVHPLPYQANRCLGPNPTVTATADRVYVTYATKDSNQTEGVRVAVFDSALRPLWSGRVGAPEQKKADQFWPAAAVDRRTGQLWVCFYDTTGDGSRREAWFVCAGSPDGRHWPTTVRAGRDSANAQVLLEDARIYGFGDVKGYGGYPAVAVGNGFAYPTWIDTRDVGKRDQEIFAARVPVGTLSR
jgi:peptide/nickel transport system permease protein